MNENYRAAMRQIESSGNYQALGKVINNPKSAYHGDRAYGAYQVMGRNIPSWTKEALGREMTPQQFLRDADAQDAVFDHFFGKSLERYGNPADAASVWHSGSTLARALERNASDGLSTTGEYVNKFMNLIGNPSNLTGDARRGYNRAEVIAEETFQYDEALPSIDFTSLLTGYRQEERAGFTQAITTAVENAAAAAQQISALSMGQPLRDNSLLYRMTPDFSKISKVSSTQVLQSNLQNIEVATRKKALKLRQLT